MGSDENPRDPDGFQEIAMGIYDILDGFQCIWMKTN